MRGRNDILADIRANKPKFSAPAPAVPSYDDHYPTDPAGLQARFIEVLEKMGGAPGYASLKGSSAGDTGEHGEMLLGVIGSDFAPKRVR